ncbi:Ubiquitin-conjugating enzyme E2 28, partial [Cucurbita argyrosperma subsp. argyrosperma]
MASKRILKEINDLQKDPSTSCSGGLVAFYWAANILFSCGEVIHLKERPTIKVTSRVDGFFNGWEGFLFHILVLLSICSLSTDANPDDLLVPEISHLYKTDRAKYETTTRSWTKKICDGLVCIMGRKA